VGKLHRLNENAYGITRLFHLSNVGVNAGFIVTKNSIIHIDAGMTVADGKSLLVRSSKEEGKSLSYLNSPSLRPHLWYASVQRSRRKGYCP
jgi:hypothetical protein